MTYTRVDVLAGTSHRRNAMPGGARRAGFLRAGGFWRALPLIGTLLAGSASAEGPDLATQLVEEIVRTLGGDTAPPGAEELLRDRLEVFYQSRNRNPAWVDAQGVLTPAGAYLLNLLQHAESDAVDVRPLHLESLQRLRALMTPAPRQLAELDVLLSDAALRYQIALQPQLTDPVSGLSSALTENRVEPFLTDLAPNHSAYRKLKAALARYQSIAATGGWPQIPTGPSLSKGMQNPQVPPLRRHLAIEGDYPEFQTPPAQGRRQIMEPGLAVALQRFQARNGLPATGKLDAATRTVLNIPVEKRIQQLRANLVRWRSVARDLGSRYLLVNVLTYRVDALENGQKRFSLRAIVGRPDRPTPSLSSDVSAIIFNPSWHVPTKLASEDLAPKQHKDPGFFSKQKIHVYRRGKHAVEVDPATINWAQIDGTKFPYRLRQDPGPENSLGHIKFAFENAFDVYLHDTPKRALFGKSQRALSSGCVRVDQPMKLATYLLNSQVEGEWNEDRIKAIIADGKLKTVRIKNPMRIHLVYWTAWVDDTDLLQFRDDIYGLDGDTKSCVSGVCVAQQIRAAEH